MLKSWSIVTEANDTIHGMMSEALSIYDKALYFQRQKYFETKKQGDIKTYDCNDLYKLVKETDVFKNAKLDYVLRTAQIRQVIANWNKYIKATIRYKDHPELFDRKPKMPNYLYKRKNYASVYVDSSRFRKVKTETEYSITLPCTNEVIALPRQIDIKSIHQLILKPYYGKVKICIVYNDETKKERIDSDRRSSIGIDIGLNNFCAITSNDKSISCVVKGGPLKSINQYYNKKRAELYSELAKCNKEQMSSRAINRLSMKRKHKIYNFIHAVANRIIRLCIENRISRIYIGHNKGWKQNANLGRKNNQNFVSVPFNDLIKTLQYKAKRYENLKVVVVEESYTSKCDHLAYESMEHHDTYLGKRVKRGLFRSSTGKELNADINGAIGILRKGKAISDVQLKNLRDRGDVVSPEVLRINP